MPRRSVESRSGVCAFVTRTLYVDVPHWLIYSYIAIASAIYIFVVVHTPLAVQADGVHDDEFFMSRGLSLAQGDWFGPYSQFTLMKGPGYPAFLAAASWTGLPVSWAHALLWCFAVVFFIIIAHQFVRSYLLSALFFTLLLWHPYAFMVLRMLREQIYPAQALLVLGTAAAALYLARTWRQRMVFATLAGLCLGWFWLTREEGIWILPGLIVLLAPAAWSAYRQAELRQLFATASLALAVFATTQIGFRAMNWYAYGMYVGVDFQEKNFQAALRALNSVQSGGTKPFVGITRGARQEVYEISPRFATLRRYLEGPRSDGWRSRACKTRTARCGEMGPGSFIWALRDAVAEKGHYSSPRKASGFYSAIARDIAAACASGRLECDARSIPAIPPFTWSQLAQQIPPLVAEAVVLLINFAPNARLERSSGLADMLARDLQFLNYPAHTPSSRMPDQSIIYGVNGRYYPAGSGWFSAEGHDGKGFPISLRIHRQGPKDAIYERFSIDTACDTECVVTFRGLGDDEGRIKLGAKQVLPVRVRLGDSEIVVENISIRSNPAYSMLKSQSVALDLRGFAMQNYRLVFIPVATLGLISFVLAALLYWRTALTTGCFVMAAASWTLVLSRSSVLILIEATAMHALQPLYLSATYAMLVCAVMFSIAALAQLVCAPDEASSPGWRATR